MSGIDEDHYDLTPPDEIDFVSDGERRRLLRLPWTGVGARRVPASRVVLEHATRDPAPRWLAAGFAGDLLSFPGHPTRVAITAREVRAWRAEREPELAFRQSDPFSLPALLAERDSELALGPRPGWLDVYRTIHGPPRTAGDR